jgi:DNA-binding NarL/FixJ family response regulator
MNDTIIIASDAIAIRNLVEGGIKMVAPRSVIEMVSDVVELNRAVNTLEPRIVFLEANFSQITTAHLMAKRLSDHSMLRFVIFSFEPLSTQDMGHFYNLGAVGFLDYRCGIEERLKGIAAVLSGKDYITRAVENTLGDYRIGRGVKANLTARERQIACLTGKGKSAEAIAELLSVCVSYVQNVKTQIHQKLGISNDVEIMHFMVTDGFIPLGDYMAGQSTKNTGRKSDDSTEQGAGVSGDEQGMAAGVPAGGTRKRKERGAASQSRADGGAYRHGSL